MRTRADDAWRRWGFDAFVAAALVALSLTMFATVTERNPRDAVDGWGLALLIVHGGCLLWRRRAPLAVMAVNLVSGLAFYALGFPVVLLGVAVVVALYTVAVRCPRPQSVGALAASIAVMASALALTSDRSDFSTIAGNAVVLAVTWFLGDSQRARRAYVAELEQRTAELERARYDLAQAAVAEERLRIARELHDVVAHSMGMIAVQAGVGAHVIDTRPDEAKRSLEAIEGASKSALGEIRRMLGLLRAPEEPAATAPSPGLDDLPRLADEAERAGLAVELRVAEAPTPLPAGAELTIYRIVQEAITNAMRHAGASRVQATVGFGDGAARVLVTDDGPSPPRAFAEGHGLAGMRERVAMHGGTFRAGPGEARGFEVVATIPLEGAAT